MKLHTRFLIVGGGPAGLGAAHRLGEHGQDDWLLLEGSHTPGGLATSVLDDHGFTWDLGGHVIFSHYDYFDRLLDELLAEQWLFHTREASVWLFDQFIPYPFQNNIWRLPDQKLVACMDDLLKVFEQDPTAQKPADFKEWILQNYGQSLADIFFFPYNWKVWAHKAEDMSSCWIGERVARVSIRQIVKNIILKQDDIGWGPNAKFRYPLKGGTGAIWKALSDRLPKDQVLYEKRVARIEPRKKLAILTSGEEISYEYMLSTIPLNLLLQCLDGEPQLADKAPLFKYSSCHIVGVGLQGAVPERLAEKFWMYFPALEVPFYRATIFSNYSANNVAEPGSQWSILCEVSESKQKPIDHATAAQSVVDGLKAVKLLEGGESIASLWHRRLEYGYPTPFVGRDELINEIDPLLKDFGIYSRGRFGGWRYEVANQDHTMMQGVEMIDHVLAGSDETTFLHPQVVNAGPKVPIAHAKAIALSNKEQ